MLDGRVLFDSAQHIDLPPQQRGVGLLFQNYALFPNMTVEQNVLCGLKAEKDPAARRTACAEMLRAMRWVLVDIAISAVVLLAVNLLEKKQKAGGRK